ncbi:hypothetical protein HYZ80_01495 [Candidatus Parcubacteria bacterium]|nr:hypothetical protein [Candidatus Parcubacteria bacterium]
MANVMVLQWRDSENAFLEPEKGLKELLAAWLDRTHGQSKFKPFSAYLVERLEPIAEMIASEFAKAHMSVEVVVLWCVVRQSGQPYLTLDLCVKRGSGDAQGCYQISRRDVMLSSEESTSATRERVERWLADLAQGFTKTDPALRLAIRELGCAFSRRRTMPEALQTALSVAGSRRAAR